MRALLFLGVPGVATAAPVQLTHQGRLLDALGAPIEAPVTLDVAIHASPSSPSPLWHESFSIDPDDGHFQVVLGSNVVGNPLADSVFDGLTRYLALTVGSTPIVPRQPITSTPAAVRATSVSGGEVRLSDTAASCGTGNRGALKYDGEVWVCAETGWTPIASSGDVGASGGSVTDVTISGTPYRLHAFTSVGAHTLSVTRSGLVDVLIVGGGGGGSSDLGGGGGAGGVLYQTNYLLEVGAYNVAVGGGGTGGSTTRYSNTVGGDGQPSSFGTLVAAGGGGGGAYWNSNATFQNGRAGGSGGGGGSGDGGQFPAGGAGSAGLGFAGGAGWGGNPHNGGGGGGAGGVGVNSTGSSGGAGGPGVANAITGTSTFYGGGGGGSFYGTSANGNVRPAGGAGGGGAGGYGQGPAGGTSSGLPGAANTGGGGGGGSWQGGVPSTGGAGGSGLVIVRYAL